MAEKKEIPAEPNGLVEIDRRDGLGLLTQLHLAIEARNQRLKETNWMIIKDNLKDCPDDCQGRWDGICNFCNSAQGTKQ